MLFNPLGLGGCITFFNLFKELAMSTQNQTVAPATSALSTETGYHARTGMGTITFASNFAAGWKAAGSAEMKAQRQETANQQYLLCIARHRKS